MKLTLIATAAMGLESIVAQEVRDLGFENVTVENGKVIFDGDKDSICKANLWLRTADRVKLRIGEFKATTFDELFEKTKALPWGEFIPELGEFPVIGKSVKSTLYSVSDCQAIVKKAVVESMRKKYKYHRISMFEETGDLYRIEVAILKDVVTLTLDTSGVGLHKRGYRVDQNVAPLKETLAAALIKLSTWNANRPLVDPFCGSGTIPIEAAMIGQNIAPGFNRDFASSSWDIIGEESWNRALEEAEDLANYDQPLDIMGTDIDFNIIDVAKNNAVEAGFADLITFKQMQVTDLQSEKEYGVIVCNPPYGERLGEREDVEKMYHEMGKTFEKLDTWSKYIITSHKDFERLYGKKATKRRKLFNGFIETQYYQYWGPRPPRN
ncbi:RNA methyltransferase [Lottiidibacillus patelloidae]|uniref:RNA methyltransferase n=1 Tax=Lottiidibacillus patelloidae TaxID=2670334 RepID=A0A263BVH5_9BACI|nr:class I SAM-dependent RNA methyltransferase [Lottiidibacillus patelloidae]OZM57327.1 RNA methyltransferase [Lottiidibacillus patelloidae]